MRYLKLMNCFVCVFTSLCFGNQSQDFDVTVVSSIDFNGSVRRHAIGLIETLYDELKMNFIASRDVCLNDVALSVQAVVLGEDKTPGKVALLEDPLEYADFVPQECKVKIAFSVYETTRLPDKLVNILNTKFDAVVVADEYFVKVYKESGVKIPIFYLPLGVYLDEFLAQPIKNNVNTPFVFRGGSRYFVRKNLDLLIWAFYEEFGNDPNIELRINGGGKWTQFPYFEELKKLVSVLSVSNIYLTNEAYSWKNYVQNMSTTDCFVNISIGEGFSILPRESLALGIPVIASDNTAQKSICASGFVRAVPSDIKIRPRGGWYTDGMMFDCRMEDVMAAMRDVYNHYQQYLHKAQQGREWVKQFRWSDLKTRYLNLIKPQRVILGDYNEVTENYLMTNSENLYMKFLEIQLGINKEGI